MSSRWSDLERPPLRMSTLENALVREGSMWREIRVLDETPSTNAVVADEAMKGADEGLVVVAEHQTSGRGRLDRTWASPPRAGLTFSVLLRPDEVPDARWTWLPLLIGVAVAAGITGVTQLEVGLKWPNDVLLGDRKLAGVLVERHGSAAVIGVGINVSTSLEELPTPDAVSLAVANATTTDRETVLRAVLRALAFHYEGWRSAAGDPQRVAVAYAEHCSTLNSEVTVHLPDGSSLAGRATRIDEAGRLVLDTTDGEVALSAGDVKHVRAG